MKNEETENEEIVFVYLLECRDRRKKVTIYTGITNNIEKRLKEHIQGQGARYTAMREVKELLAVWPCKNRSDALKLEYRVKRLPHEKKRELVQHWRNPDKEYPFPPKIWREIQKKKRRASQKRYYRDEYMLSQAFLVFAKLS